MIRTQIFAYQYATRFPFLCIFLGVFLGICIGRVGAAEIDWQGPPTGDWTEGTNWLGGLPSIDDNVHIRNNGTANLSKGSGVYGNLFLGDKSAQSGALNISGGSLGGTNATIGDNGGAGSVRLTGGNWTNSKDMVVGNGAGSNGKLMIEGGILTTDYLAVGQSDGEGSLIISGGVLKATRGIDVGDFSSETKGSVELIGGTFASRRVVGNNTSGAATFLMNGGTLQATDNDTRFIQGFKNESFQIGSGGGTIDTNGFSVGAYSQLSGAEKGKSLYIINSSDEGAGKLTLYVGATYVTNTIIGGNVTLTQGQENTLSPNSSVDVTKNGTLDLGGFDGTIGALSGEGKVTNSKGENGKLTVGVNNESGDFSGVLTDGAQGATLQFTKTGTGTQVLTGVNTYSGGTKVEGGTLIGTTHSLQQKITVDPKTVLQFSQSDSGEFKGVISGAGTVKISNSNTEDAITFGENQDYTGDTIIDKGTLHLNTELATSQIAVNKGGVLTGTGITDHDVIVHSGGWMKPGGTSEPGTFTIKGNYQQEEGSNVLFRIGGLNNYDHIDVQGSAKLSGNFYAVQVDHFIPPDGSKYNVIHTTDGINSTKFNNEQIDTPLKLYAEYTGTDVNLVMKQEDFVPWSSLTSSMKSPMSCLNKALLDSVITAKGSLHDALADLEFMPKDSIMPYLEQLMPRAAAEIKEVLFNNTNTQYGQITERLSSIRSGVGAVSINGLSQEPMQQQATQHEETLQNQRGEAIAYQQPGYDLNREHWNIFTTASGIFSKIDTVYDLPTMHTITGNFSAGMDYKFNEHLDAGLFCGYEGFRTNFSDSSVLRSSGVKFGAYGTASWNGFYLNAIVGAGFNSLGMSRVVDMRNVMCRCEGDHWVARGNPSAAELDTLLGGGYEYQLGGWRFGANASIQYTYLHIGGYQESDADTLNLQVDGQDPGSMMSTVGGNISYTWQISPSIKLMPSVGLAWQHQFLDYSQNLYAAFCNGEGAHFFTPTVKGERDDIYGTAGLYCQIGKHFGTYAYYNPIFAGSQIVSHGALVGVAYSF